MQVVMPGSQQLAGQCKQATAAQNMVILLNNSINGPTATAHQGLKWTTSSRTGSHIHLVELPSISRQPPMEPSAEGIRPTEGGQTQLQLLLNSQGSSTNTSELPGPRRQVTRLVDAFRLMSCSA
jgi:hypothetical protein